jgi:hypothetical protein
VVEDELVGAAGGLGLVEVVVGRVDGERVGLAADLDAAGLVTSSAATWMPCTKERLRLLNPPSPW